MMTPFIRAAFCLALATIGLSSASAQQTILEGNPLSDRAFNSDIDSGSDLFVVDFTITNAATMYSVQTWGQNSGGGVPSVGQTFYAFVLRPMGTNLQVVAETGLNTVANLGVNIFPTYAFNLQTGDAIAHLGRGIPLTTGTGGPSVCYENGNGIPMPSVGDFITLPSAGFPLYSDGGRNYAIAVGLTPLPYLNIALAGTNVVVSWPATNSYPLMQTTNLNGGPWITTSNYTTVNTTNILTVPASAQQLYWSLRNPQ